jgi:hypothetical protein
MNFNPQGRRLLRNLLDGPLRVSALGFFLGSCFAQSERKERKETAAGMYVAASVSAGSI